MIHTASPSSIILDVEDEVVKPAVEGTNAVLKACTQHGVKRLVVTSSGGTIFCVPAKDVPPEG